MRGNPGEASRLAQRLSALMDQHGQSILHTCFLILKDAHAAEDMAQETFLKAYKALPGFRGEASEKTWLMRIAVNTCRDYLRTAWIRRVDRRVQLEDLPLVHPDSEPFDDTLTQAILRLPKKLRTVVVLYYFSGLTMEEAAEVLGLTRRVVRYRLEQARAALRKDLKEWFYDEG